VELLDLSEVGSALLQIYALGCRGLPFWLPGCAYVSDVFSSSGCSSFDIIDEERHYYRTATRQFCSTACANFCPRTFKLSIAFASLGSFGLGRAVEQEGIVAIASAELQITLGRSGSSSRA